MSINERFETIIKQLYNGNKRSFAIAIGVSPTVIENVVGTRQGKPSYDVLEKVCANANISPSWLLLDEGEMLQKKKMATIQTNTLPTDSGNNYLVDKVIEQAEEIGILKERIKQLERVKDTTAWDAPTSTGANAG